MKKKQLYRIPELKRIILLLAINLSVFATAFSQISAPVTSNDTTETGIITGNLDQLMNLWYLNKMAVDTSIEDMNKYGFKEGEVPQYSDSIYKYRLNILNCPISLTYNDNVRRFIDLYTIRKREQVERMLGLSHYYFPMFETVLDQHGLPLELKYVACIESALNPHAVSKSGATGLWQFMYGTAKLYNLQITSYIDERRDPYRLTEKAVLFMKDLYDVYHDWLFVIAAYNCGPGNVNKAIKKSGNRKDFWEVYPYLPAETRGYVPAFIAANYVMTYYAEHNLYPRNPYNPGMIDTVNVYRRIKFETLAKSLNVPVDLLRELNPQYRKDEVPQSVTEIAYTIRLPIEQASKFHQLGDLVYKYQDYVDKQQSELLAIHDSVIVTPKYTSTNTVKYRSLSYKVKPGDKLENIADWYDCTTNDIKGWNHTKSSYVSVGKTLVIHVSIDMYDYFKDVNQMSFVDKQKRVGKYNDTAVSLTKTVTPPQNQTKTYNPTSIPGGYVFYTIKNGDTLWTIAQKYPGVTPGDLMKLNGISHSKTLKPGQKIKIKPKA